MRAVIELARAVQMVRDWWELHPELGPESMNDSTPRERTVWKCKLYMDVNAASDGELATLVPDRHGREWIIVVGFAASGVTL